MQHVQNPCLPHTQSFQKGHREKKGEIEQGKDTISPWMLWEHRNMDAFTGTQCYTRKKNTHSSVKGCGKANHLLQCTHNSQKLQSYVSRVEESRYTVTDEATSKLLRNAVRISLFQGWKLKPLKGIHNSSYGKKQDKDNRQKKRRDQESRICCLPGRRMVAIFL